MRWKLVTWLTIQATEVSGIVLKDRDWPHKAEDYGLMPKLSVGHQYSKLISSKTIEYKPNLVKHDMKHIILGYDMNIRNELNIVAFLIGNRSSNKVSIFYLIICLLIVPEYLFQLKKHFKRGRSANRLKDYNIASLVEHDLKSVRQILNIN